MPEAVCTRCERILPLDQFAKDAHKASGRKSWCKACDKDRCKAYYYANQIARQAAARARSGYQRKPPIPCKDCGALVPATTRSKRCGSCYLSYRRQKARVNARARYTTEQQRLRDRRKRLRRKAATIAAWEPKATPLALPPGPPPTCALCNSPRPSRRLRYCSDRCAAKANTINQHDWHVSKRKQVAPLICGWCAECGSPWVSRGSSNRFCSDTCQRRAQRRRGKQIRRARLKAVPTEPIDLAAIAERDGWRCHICQRKVTRKTWSLDHLIPIADGGHHTHDNVALAHHRCNTIRGTRGAAQLRLAA